MCVGLYATDVLNLQNDMQTYHEDMEGITKYINKLEDAHKQSTRAGNLITEPTLLLFVENSMLRTNLFPRANEIWEELTGANRTWAIWKAIYRKADMAKKIKKSAQGGLDHFGENCAFDKVPGTEGEMLQLYVVELDGYFSSLANAAKTEK